MFRKMMILTAVVICLLTVSLTAETISLKVLQANTPIRETPSLTGKVLFVANEGAILKSDGAQNGWYRVLLPEQTASTAKIGYVFENKVQADSTAAERNTPMRALSLSDKTHEAPVTLSDNPTGFQRHYLSIGCGLGIPYGGACGVNIELYPAIPTAEFLGDYFGITICVGYAVDGVGVGGGINFYPLTTKTPIRPRFSYRMGTIGSFEGIGYSYLISAGMLSAGCDVDIAPHFSIDADVMFILFDFDEGETSGKFKVSAGVRWNL